MITAIGVLVIAATSLVSGLQSDLQQYLDARAHIEHISAISLSIYVPGDPSNINMAVEHMQYGGSGAAITPAALYQIGSNTKSFTAATILQLEDEGVLSIGDTVGKWLPQYPAWKDISIRRLLNMTSDIPTYDDVESMLSAYAQNPTKDFTTKELVGMVYPRLDANGKWLYSNTAYLLSEMIIERATHHTCTQELYRRFLNNPRASACTQRITNAISIRRQLRAAWFPGTSIAPTRITTVSSRSTEKTCAI